MLVVYGDKAVPSSGPLCSSVVCAQHASLLLGLAPLAAGGGACWGGSRTRLDTSIPYIIYSAVCVGEGHPSLSVRAVHLIHLIMAWFLWNTGQRSLLSDRSR